MNTFGKDLLKYDGLLSWKLYVSHMFRYDGAIFTFVEDDEETSLRLPEWLEPIHDELFDACVGKVPDFTITEWDDAELIRWLKKHKPEVITECIALMKIQES